VKNFLHGTLDRPSSPRDPHGYTNWRMDDSHCIRRVALHERASPIQRGGGYGAHFRTCGSAGRGCVWDNRLAGCRPASTTHRISARITECCQRGFVWKLAHRETEGESCIRACFGGSRLRCFRGGGPTRRQSGLRAKNWGRPHISGKTAGQVHTRAVGIGFA
jgi:hypothetical protein